MADRLASLPTDENPPTHPELQMVDYLFGKDGSQKKINGLIGEFKLSLIAGALFVILSLPWVDTLFRNFISVANNDVILMIIKTVLFVVIFYFISNFWIVRKKDY